MRLYLTLSLAFLPAGLLLGSRLSPATVPQGAACVECHAKISPQIVSDWKLSKHSQADVDCATCHGGDHTSDADVAKVRIPTPDTCAPCHEARVAEFKKGKHAAAWAAMKAMPTDDTLFGKGAIRQDGRKMHPMYLFEVKKPSESKADWDYYRLIERIAPEQAFRPLSEGGCKISA